MRFPSEAQQYAIQAKLNMLLGAEEYDAVFLGFECGAIIDCVLQVYLVNEFYAGQADALYIPEIIYAAEMVLNRRVDGVSILPKDFSNRPLSRDASH